MNVIHENVLVEVTEIVKEKGGILLPESDIVTERTGTVIRFGESIPIEVQNKLTSKPRIEYKEYYDGSELKIDGKQYIVMSYKDILIIL